MLTEIIVVSTRQDETNAVSHTTIQMFINPEHVVSIIEASPIEGYENEVLSQVNVANKTPITVVGEPHKLAYQFNEALTCWA